MSDKAPAETEKTCRPKHSKHNDLVSISRPLLALFEIYVRRFMRRHFHAVRIVHSDRCPAGSTSGGFPLIICVNHASWWDPLVGLLISRHLLSRAGHYVPMDAAALDNYRLFRRMGAFPVEQGSLRGAAQFLRSSLQVLTGPGHVLWITPQGTFTDPRTRPVVFQPGLAALAARLPLVTILPIAIEYTFWNERLPEILINVGQPITVHADSGGSPAAQLEKGMEQTLDELAALAITRDPAAFNTLLAGGTGMGGIYEMWLRFRAAITGREYKAEHWSIRK